MAISLTPAAARHIEKSLKKRGSGIGLRVAIKTSGCSGFAYALEFVDEPSAEDHSFHAHGVTIVVDPRSLSMLDGTELDFVREGLNEGFKFNNPNATANCGCGESFAV
jgi:iron-sulfur cluster assembly protein